jgi:16S rRNA (guanine966-N2)-methyltransferase
MVRQAIFNVLTSRGGVEGAGVADLFAGSGALGIEALSRGAEHCTFVENDRVALRQLEQNIRALALGGSTTVVAGDVLDRARRLHGVDIVFADPPYTFGAWAELLAALAEVGVSTVVAESDRAVSVDGWEVVRSKRYGRTWVTVLDRVR